MVYAQPSICPKNDTHKLLWYFDIQTDHLISARRPALIIINNNNNSNKQKKKKKRICQIVALAVPADHRIKLKEYEKKNKYLDLARELEKTMEHDSDNYTNCDRCFRYSNGRLGSWRTSRDHPNYSIIENGHNTEKSHGDLRRLAVTQTLVKDHQLTLMWKTQGVIIIIITAEIIANIMIGNNNNLQ